jgi:hypothetical protein
MTSAEVCWIVKPSSKPQTQAPVSSEASSLMSSSPSSDSVLSASSISTPTP